MAEMARFQVPVGACVAVRVAPELRVSVRRLKGPEHEEMTQKYVEVVSESMVRLPNQSSNYWDH